LEKTDYTDAHNEANFTINELFFSITRKDSTILSGNEVFVRISGYTKQELIGSFHNIIRHPDMPKIIFKTLWDYLNADKPIVAYVKNRAKSGEYYWVLAAIFPRDDRYISIRIKPTTQIFTAVRELYSELLTAEKSGGMEKSGKMVSDRLSALGYKDYDQFMSDALLQELQERKRLVVSTSLKEENVASASPLLLQLKSAYEYTTMLMNEYDVWFDEISTFIQTKLILEEKSLLLRQVAREIVFLSLNASVSSYKVINGGETFGILARDIRINAKENDTLIDHIDTIVHRLSDSLNAMVFSVAGMRLQIETVTYFIKELLCKECDVSSDEISESMGALIALVTEYSAKLNTLQTQIDRQLQETLMELDQLEQQMMYLGYIQVYGLIESAGYRNETVSFEGIFSQLKTLIQRTSQEINTMQKIGESFYTENRLLMEKSQRSVIVLERLHETMAAIKEKVEH